MLDRVGQQLGNYRIIQRLGSGGFADVYLGEHVYLKTSVAVKVLQARISGPEDMSSFLQEAQMIARLIHPHIIRVTDFGVDDEVPFLVMDYAPNGTLRQKHPRGSRLPLTTIVSYVKQLADALQHAHDEKLIHRDIKPENMLLGRRNEVLLSDFGIALIAQSSRDQSTQDFVGTVAYMSPEQIQGKPRPASDQYSLGVVVYEWLSGDRPFRGSFTELCTQHMFATPPSLHEKIPGIAPHVERVVMTALAKEPKQRFGSIQAFANALEQASQSISPQANVATVQPTNVPPAQPKASPLPPPARPVEVQRVSPVVSTSPQPRSLAPATYRAHVPSQIQPLPAMQRTIQPPHARQAPKGSNAERYANVWHFGKRERIAASSGTILFIIFSALLEGYILATRPPISPTPGFITTLILAGCAEVTVFFYATVFGPWVGAFIGGIGSIIGSSLPIRFIYNYSSFRDFLGSTWFYYPSAALFGFLMGLVILKTQGRYERIRDIALAVGFSVLGFIAAIVVLDLFSIISHYSSSSSVLYYRFIILFTLVTPGLLLLPIALFIYGRITLRKKRIQAP